jgi:hypothetical protein
VIFLILGAIESYKMDLKEPNKLAKFVFNVALSQIKVT